MYNVFDSTWSQVTSKEHHFVHNGHAILIGLPHETIGIRDTTGNIEETHKFVMDSFFLRRIR